MVKYLELGKLAMKMVFHSSYSGWHGLGMILKRLAGLSIVSSGAELEVCG